MKKSKSKPKKVKKVKKVASKAKAKAKATVASKNKLGVTPLGDKVLVKPIVPEATTPSGIILTNSKDEKPETGTVVAVGPGRRNEQGVLQPMNVQVGDKIMFSKYGFDEVKLKGEDYYLISESNIQAILD
jgi:chaperonin GroES